MTSSSRARASTAERRLLGAHGECHPVRRAAMRASHGGTDRDVLHTAQDRRSSDPPSAASQPRGLRGANVTTGNFSRNQRRRPVGRATRCTRDIPPVHGNPNLGADASVLPGIDDADRACPRKHGHGTSSGGSERTPARTRWRSSQSQICNLQSEITQGAIA